MTLRERFIAWWFVPTIEAMQIRMLQRVDEKHYGCVGWQLIAAKMVRQGEVFGTQTIADDYMRIRHYWEGKCRGK